MKKLGFGLMRLPLTGPGNRTGESTEVERIRMLDKLRSKVMDELHYRQPQIGRLDYLRYKIQSNRNLISGFGGQTKQCAGGKEISANKY